MRSAWRQTLHLRLWRAGAWRRRFALADFVRVPGCGGTALSGSFTQSRICCAFERIFEATYLPGSTRRRHWEPFLSEARFAFRFTLADKEIGIVTRRLWTFGGTWLGQVKSSTNLI